MNRMATLAVTAFAAGVALGCAPGTPCDTATSTRARLAYLGDGTTDYHYYPIVDFLRDNPGSEANTRTVEREEQEAARSPHDLKPPSSGIIESEFSHLLGVIARHNGGMGAAVFDTTGLKVGAAGWEISEFVLPAELLDTLRKAPDDPPVEVRYTCNELRELFPLDDLAQDCKAPITMYYRPVIDYQRDSRLVGFSTLAVQDEPACKDAAQ